MSKIAETYKARDVEEIVDIYFYRPLGYQFALMAQKLKMTPNQVTVVGMLFGIAAGHFFFYNDWTLNAIGIFCWIMGQALDGADGQLARMTNQRSQFGRILDGAADTFKFTSVYVHLFARIWVATGGWWLILIGFVAGLVHQHQSAIADLYRNLYLFFVENPEKAEFERSETIIENYTTVTWRTPMRRFLVDLYIRYTQVQERYAHGSLALQRLARQTYGTQFPEALRTAYRTLNKPLLFHYNAMTTNTRMIVLYITLALVNSLGSVYYFGVYFGFELLYLGGIMLWTKNRQRHNDLAIAQHIEGHAA